MGSLGEIDDILNASQAAPKPKRAHKAAAPPPGGGVSEQEFAQYLEDPTPMFKKYGRVSNAPLSPDQFTRLRQQWKILGTPLSDIKPEEHANNAELLKNLEDASTHAETVFSAPIDKKTIRAAQDHFAWAKEHADKPGGILRTADPAERLKGQAREQAQALIALAALKMDKQGAAASSGEKNPLTVMYTSLPAVGDTPDIIAKKRERFATELLHTAEKFPSNNAENAIPLMVRARRLAGGTAAPVPTATPAAPGASTTPVAKPQPPDKVAPYGLTGVITGQQQPEAPTMGTGEAIGRGLLHGATNLSATGIAALAHGMTREGGYEVPIGEGMTQWVADPNVHSDSVPFKEANAEMHNMIEDPAKLAQAREQHPFAAGAGEFAGGFADPTNIALGPLMAAPGLSTAGKMLVRAGLGGATAAANEAGETGEAPTARTTLMGAGLGAIGGHLTDKLLESPANAKVMKKILGEHNEVMRPSSTEAAAKRAAVIEAAQGTAEGRAVTAGDPKAIQALGPHLVDRRNAILEAHGVKPGSKIATAVDEVEEAIDKGDIKGAEAKRAELRKKFGKDAAEMDKLFTTREVLRAAREAHAEHGGTGGQSHPLALLGSGNATLPETVGAVSREVGEGRGKNAIGAYLAGKVKGAMGPARTGQEALAKMWYARQTGNQSLMRQAAGEALRLGIHQSTIKQMSAPLGEKGQETLEDLGVLE